jgi:hypothetical protein
MPLWHIKKPLIWGSFPVRFHPVYSILILDIGSVRASVLLLGSELLLVVAVYYLVRSISVPLCFRSFMTFFFSFANQITKS